VPHRDAGLKETGWGRRITPAAARALKKSNPAAEHFMYYDVPPWSQPPTQAYLDAVTPEHVKKRIAEVQARRSETK
jgi:hypothetical protein